MFYSLQREIMRFVWIIYFQLDENFHEDRYNFADIAVFLSD